MFQPYELSKEQSGTGNDCLHVASLPVAGDSGLTQIVPEPFPVANRLIVWPGLRNLATALTEAVEECKGGELVCAVSGLRHSKTWLFKPTPPFTGWWKG